MLIETWLATSVFAVVGGLLHWDRVAVFQSLFHRPVFVAPVGGFLIGDPMAGVFVAVLTEFASLLVPPTGTDLPPDESSWAITSLVAYGFAGAVPSTLPLALGLGLLSLPLAQTLERWVREGNDRLAVYADRQAGKTERIPFKRLVFVSLIGRWLVFGGLYLGGGLFLSLVIDLIEQLPVRAIKSFLGGSLFLILTIPAAQLLRGANFENRNIWRSAVWGLGALIGLTGWLR